MRIGSIWLGCKLAIALLIVVSFLAPIALGQQPIYTVTGSNFQLNGPCTVTRIDVSHSNNGQQYGKVWLIDQSGNNYGPWNADTSSSTWRVFLPNSIYLMAGTYRLVDSDPGTYQGQAWIYGNT